MSILSSTHSGQHKVVRELYEQYGMKYSKVVHNPDGSIDYIGSLNLRLSMCKDGRISLPFKLATVTGSFSCVSCDLTTLEGCPTCVGAFDCAQNCLTSLDGGPQHICTGIFNCSYNLLTSLEGCPRQNMEYFYCNNNRLTSLDGGPTNACKIYECSCNERLDNFDSVHTGSNLYANHTMYEKWAKAHPEQDKKMHVAYFSDSNLWSDM